MADKEQTAIMRFQTASAMSLQYYNQPLVITTSGGKDSSVCVELAIRAGIPFEVMHNHTTAAATSICWMKTTGTELLLMEQSMEYMSRVIDWLTCCPSSSSG